MAPLSESKMTTFVESKEDGTKVYSIKLDPEWTFSSVPFGGYTFSIVLNAAIQSQRDSHHPDPIYATCFFVKPLQLHKTAELHVRPIESPSERRGRYTNLRLELIQDSVIKNIAQLIFGDITSETGPSFPDTHRPICPLTLHPSTIPKLSRKFAQHNFSRHYEWAIDRTVEQHDSEALFGSWTEFADKSSKERLDADSLPMFLDVTDSPLGAAAGAAGEPRDAAQALWYPTIVLNLEFKVKFPLTQVGDDDAVPLTLGQYSRKTHCKNGRYTDSTELWTAPCGIGDKAHVVDENWREKMVCVAVGGQMGLIVPATLNTRHRATVKPKL